MSKQPSVTLASVKSDFLNWRSLPNKSKIIPEALWDKVILLLPHYKKRNILDTLSLNHAQLKRKLTARDITFQKNKHSFVKAIVTTPTQFTAYFDVILTKSNGATLQINKLSHDDILKLTQLFVG